MKYIINKTFVEIELGQKAHIIRTLTQKDIDLFAIISGDVNPAHVDPEYAKDDIFHKIIAHGMWSGALISAVLGTLLPGPGAIYLSQTLNFLRPVTLGDTITAMVTVIKKYTLVEEYREKKTSEKHIVELECKCINQHNQEVITGIAKILAPMEKVKRERVKLPKLILQRIRKRIRIRRKPTIDKPTL